MLDRSALILDIFAQRAKTKEGRLQVELAQYQYLLPRLTGMWTHLERQAGTSGKGPIGSKGPGETQLETDRRHIRRKIDKLRETWRRSAGCAPPSGSGGRRTKSRWWPLWLYQRGQVHAAEPPDRSGHPRQQPAVRHAGHHQPPSHGQRHAGRGDLRHGGVHPQAAPPAGGGIQGHAGGVGVRRSAAPRHRRVQPGVAAAGGGGGEPDPGAGGRRAARIDVFNKSDRLPPERSCPTVRISAPSPPRPARVWTSCWR